MQFRSIEFSLGSPPRVWGKHPSPSQCAAGQRFTPTCVGKTCCWESNSKRYCGSPPRVWGKHAPVNPGHVPPNGSPPRVWGKHDCSPTITTVSDGSPPRVWGKQNAVAMANPSSGGSPPRVWGKLSPLAIADPVFRGSPPRVWGKLVRSFRTRNNHPVHPHVCGENSRPYEHDQGLDRFTPTCVGKTPTWWRMLCAPLGSPPRVWGKLVAPALRMFVAPVHPHVCGENLPCRRRVRARWPVHPHVCGENSCRCP